MVNVLKLVILVTNPRDTLHSAPNVEIREIVLAPVIVIHLQDHRDQRVNKVLRVFKVLQVIKGLEDPKDLRVQVNKVPKVLRVFRDIKVLQRDTQDTVVPKAAKVVKDILAQNPLDIKDYKVTKVPKGFPW